MTVSRLPFKPNPIDVLARASRAALVLADSIERFARLDDRRRCSLGEQYALNLAISSYEQARIDVTLISGAPAMPAYSIGYLYINASDDELLEELRTLRGPEVYRVRRLEWGATRFEPYYPNGIAGRLEAAARALTFKGGKAS